MQVSVMYFSGAMEWIPAWERAERQVAKRPLAWSAECAAAISYITYPSLELRRAVYPDPAMDFKK